MPRKTIRRFLPDIKGLLERPSLRWIRSLPQDPNLLHLNRQSVSLAVFVGIFCAFIPLPIQSLLVIALCFWIGANLPLAMLIIWMSNPITIPPMFFLTYKLGSSILGTELGEFAVTLNWQWFSQLDRKFYFLCLSAVLLLGLYWPLWVTSLSCFCGVGKSLKTGKREKTFAQQKIASIMIRNVIPLLEQSD
jgi:uncharacterized protein (DUF2062 family)